MCVLVDLTAATHYPELKHRTLRLNEPVRMEYNEDSYKYSEGNIRREAG